MSTKSVTRPLTAAEVDLKVELEETIRAGLSTFAEVGQALAQVRDARLYRDRYSSFEDYCVGEWQLSRSRGYQMIEAAETVSTIVDSGLPAPANEAQARELARVPEEQRAEVWEKTLAETDGKPTAAAVKAAAAPPAPIPPPVVAPPEEPPAEKPDAESVRTPIGAMSRSVDKALDKHVPGDEAEAADWRAAFMKALGGVHRVMRFTAEDFARLGDNQCFNELADALDHLDGYVQAVRKARLESLPDNVTELRRHA